MKVRLENLTVDEDIYPRPRISQKTVENYMEALKGGAVFPPIDVQKVLVEKNGRQMEELICLDGFHRIQAYKEYNIVTS